MRRWNGWGDETVAEQVPASALGYLERLVGPGTRPRDATFEATVAGIGPGQLPKHPLVAPDPEVRLRHARGQSFADWVALRSGRVGRLPDGVAQPTADGQVAELLRYAAAAGARVVPWGGGTSVVGGVTPPCGPEPALTIDLGRLAGLRRCDDGSGLATFGAGTAGPDLEAALRARGLTLGHFPQSFEYSTLGGWIATRSSGQQSLGYGRIEQLFAGGHLESPAGPLDLPPHPASAAGPDLRQVVLGSEGRLGIVTEATVRTTPLPEVEAFPAVFLPDFEAALAAVRELARARLPLSMVRLSTPVETATTLALAGHERLLGWLRRYLRARGVGPGRCLLLLGVSGRRRLVRTTAETALAICRAHGGVGATARFGRTWQAGRFRTPYLRNALWEHGYAVDTLETAVGWSAVPGLAAAVASALRHGLEADDERVHAFSHLSHVYPSGSSIYTTYLWRLSGDPDRDLDRWRRLKGAASEAIVAAGGTISHQHGVGRDHAPYLAAEKGMLGLAAIADVARRFDPAGLLNPGVLLGDEAEARP
ncbi:MAG TPA: FAD-binding oxidoreductase [Candidatus Limnocylindrales bacterium]